MAGKKSKIRNLDEIVRITARAKKRGLKIVTTNGCFDIIHVGHIRNLAYAKSLGDLLVVGLNSDASVRKLKGRNRPIVPAKERAEVLVALACVDYVFFFGTHFPMPWLKKIKPDIHVKGAGSVANAAELPENKTVEQNGGRTMLAPYVSGKSTTNIVKKIARLAVRGAV